VTIRLAAAGTEQSFSWEEIGFSEESRDIYSRIVRILEERRRPISYSWRDTLRDELDEILQECSKPAWDGYDAEPISLESAVVAQEFINVLPENVQTPSLVPEPSGEIALEWRAGDQKYFSVSMSGDGLTYAGIFGGYCKKYGEERFFGKIPATISHILTHYFAEVR
jgi:hypothetical protein